MVEPASLAWLRRGAGGGLHRIHRSRSGTGDPAWRRAGPHARLANVSHPSLGLPPRDERAGFPDAAARLNRNRKRIGQRALEIAIDRDPAFRDRYDEYAMRQLLRDTEILIDRLALSVASNDPLPMREFADQVVPVYRRRKVSMDDLIKLAEGLRASADADLVGDEEAPMHAAIDAAIAVFKWHRRIAGDARKRNRLLQAIYKGG